MMESGLQVADPYVHVYTSHAKNVQIFKMPKVLKVYLQHYAVNVHGVLEDIRIP